MFFTPEPNARPASFAPDLSDERNEQDIRKVSENKRSDLVLELTYQKTETEAGTLQNRIDKAFDILFETTAKGDVHRY